MAGSAVRVKGTRWKERTKVRLSFAQNGDTMDLGSVGTDRNGVFSVATSLPANALPGAAAFLVTGRGKVRRDLTCSAAFTVLQPPPPVAAWGVDAYSAPTTGIQTAETDMGRPFASWAGYRRIDDAATYPRFILAPMSRSALVYLNINNYALDPTTGAHVPYCWSSMATGSEDAMVDAWAQAIVSSGYMDKTVITFDHEPDVDSAVQPKCSTDDPAGYQAAFDHFYKRMRADGVTSRFAFVPTVRLYVSNAAVSSYLPPSDDFQLLGADIYNNVSDPTKKNYRSFAAAADPFYSWAAANEPGMPLLIGELGEVQDDANAPQWIGDALSYMKSHGNLLFVNWNLVDAPPGSYSPLLRADTYQVWLGGAADTYFSG